MTDDERERHRAIDRAAEHVESAVKDLSATIKQALNLTPAQHIAGTFRRMGSA